MIRRLTVVLVVAVRCGMTTAAAQTPQQPPAADSPRTEWSIRNWTRAELWSFFEPPAGGGESQYAFGANRLQFTLQRTNPRIDLTAALQYVQFAGLPTNAIGPGPLGLGAVYFAHAGRSDSRQVYLRYLNLRWKDALPGVNLQVGRMPYASGSEAASGDAKIEAVKRQRVDARLVGEFDWSIYQRGYDGLRAEFARSRWSVGALAVHPTQGGFEDAAGATMRDIIVLGGNVTLRPSSLIPRTEWQVFALRYGDHRDVTSRPDNTGLPASAAAVEVNTFGTTLAASSVPRGGRQWDGLLWMAGQTGSWYAQSHRAFSIVAEVGHQWTAAPWRPWLRGGVLHASGDDDPGDAMHGTFFQLLPTVRRYAQSATFSQMNQIDLFAQTMLRPRDALGLRLDVHRVSLASPRDGWYFGSGATQSRGTVFGFATRPSGGATRLGTAFEVSADYVISPRWSINGYFGTMSSGPVVRTSFAERPLVFGYLENVVQF